MIDDRYGVKRNLTLPLLVAAGFVLAGAYLVYEVLTSYSISSDKILIAVEVPEDEAGAGVWWGSGGESSLRVIKGLKEPLETLGFTLVLPNDKEALAVLKGARGREAVVAAARSLGAGVIIDGRLEVKKEVVLAEGKAVELILEGGINISLTDGAPEDTKWIPLRRLQVGPDRQDAIRLAAAKTTELAFDEIVSSIMFFPEIDALFDKSNRTPEQAKVAVKIRKAHNFIDIRSAALSKRDQLLANAEERWRSQAAGPTPVTQLSPFGREDYLVGVMPNSSGVVATVKERRYFMDLASFKVKSSWLPERQDFIDPKGASHELFEAFNIFSYPGMSADGGTLAVVTQEHGTGYSLRLVEIDASTGQAKAPKVLLTVASPQRIAHPTVSADGARILFSTRSCPRCNSSLEVIDADGKNRRFIFKSDDWRGVGDAHWVGPGHEKVGYVLYHDERPRRFFIKAIDEEKSPGTLVHANSDEAGSYINERFSADGELLVYVKGGPDGRQLMVRELDGGETRALTTNIYVKRPTVSFDNKWVAFEATGRASPKDRYARDHEVAIVPVSGEGEVRYLTVNDFKDRHLRWAPDKHEIYFETVYEDPDSGAPWVAIRSLAVDVAQAP